MALHAYCAKHHTFRIPKSRDLCNAPGEEWVPNRGDHGLCLKSNGQAAMIDMEGKDPFCENYTTLCCRRQAPNGKCLDFGGGTGKEHVVSPWRPCVAGQALHFADAFHDVVKLRVSAHGSRFASTKHKHDLARLQEESVMLGDRIAAVRDDAADFETQFRAFGALTRQAQASVRGVRAKETEAREEKQRRASNSCEPCFEVCRASLVSHVLRCAGPLS